MKQARASYCVKSEVLQFLAPFSACILQPWLQLILFGFGIYLVVNAVAIDERFADYGAAHFSAFRFLGVAVRGNGSITFELLRKGCSILTMPVPFNYSIHPASVPLMSFLEPRAVDGFSLTVSEGSNLFVSSPGNIILEGSNDQRTWTLAGSSNYRLASAGPRFFSGAAPLSSSLSFDFRAPWPLYANTVVTRLIIALTCWATAACGAHARLRAVGHERLYSTVFLLWCALLALLSLIVGVGYLTLGLGRDSIPPLSDCTVYCLLAAALAAAEVRFFDVMRVAAIYSVCVRILTDCGLFNDCGYLAAQPPLEPLVLAVVGFAFVRLRRRYLRRVIASVRGDYEQREADWRRAAAAASPTGALLKLADAVEAMAAGCRPELARQLNRRRIDAPGNVGRGGDGFKGSEEPVRVGSHGDSNDDGHGGDHFRVWAGGRLLAALRSGLPCLSRRVVGPPGQPTGASRGGGSDSEAGAVDPASPVTSLDQLYAQASGRRRIHREGRLGSFGNSQRAGTALACYHRFK